MRVVSLLPSATELLASVVDAETLTRTFVGRSHECDFPAGLDAVPILTKARTHGGASADIDAEVSAALAAGTGTGTSLYELDEQLLAELAPDVILTQSLCDVCSIDLRTVERIAAKLPKRPVVVNLDPKSIFDVFDDLLRVGEACGLAQRAENAMVALRARYWSAVDYVNPYIHSPIKLSEQERTSQESVSVWDRAFDFKKYMEHDGPLKVTNFYNNELFM